MRLRTQAPRSLVQAGFTLIELIIVIVIIGILAAIAIPKFQDLTGTAQSNADKATAAQMASAAAITYAASKSGMASAPSYTSSCNSVAGYLQGGALPTNYSMDSSSSGTNCVLKGPTGNLVPFSIP